MATKGPPDLSPALRKRAARSLRNRPLRFETLEIRATPATLTWSGGGTSNNWTDPLNWTGSAAPQFGDELVFPAGVPSNRLNPNNNLPTNTTFDSITISGSGYTLGGAQIALGSNLTNNGYIYVPGGLGDAVVNFDIRLNGTATSRNFLTAEGGSRLTIGGHLLSSPGIDLVVDRAGVVILNNTNFFTGPYTVQQGQLLVNSPGTAGSIVLDGGTLGGTGAVGAVTTASGGAINPGNNLALVPVGTLRTGAVTATANDALLFDLRHVSAGTPVAGTDNDLLSATGNVVLGTSTLAGTFDPTVRQGDVFTVIQTTGTVSGKFVEPNGVNIAMVNSKRFLVDYSNNKRVNIQYLGLVVDTLVDENDGDYSVGDLSLREAINIANQDLDADVITFSPTLFGTVPRTLFISIAAQSGEMGLPIITSQLTIDGPGADLLTITRLNTALVGDFRLFTAGLGSLATLRGMTITNPQPVSNLSQFTGGVFNNIFGVLTIEDSVLKGSISNFDGAAIFNAGVLTVLNSQIFNNTSFGNGAGISNTVTPFLASPIATITDSTIANNTAAGSGGGINNEGRITIFGSTISGNAAGQAGGGMTNAGVANVVNSTIASNGANASGGGISNFGFLTSTDVTFADNLADADNTGQGQVGGGIGTGTAAVTSLFNTIVAGNGRGSGAFDDLSGTVVQAISSNNVISSTLTSGGLINGVNGNIVGNGGSGTLSLGSILATNSNGTPKLADNGGNTLTIALASNSPALDTGATSTLVTPSTVTSSTGATDFYPAFQLVDNSGLSNVPTVSNFSAITHASALLGNTSWATAASVLADYFRETPNPVLTFNLGGLFDLTDLVIWGYDLNGVSNNEAKTFEVAFSIDGGLTFGTPVTVTQPSRSDTASRRLSFGSTFTANVVRVTITDNFFGAAGATDGNRVGLGEVKFIGLPTFDQRGAPRVTGASVDIGAFETYLLSIPTGAALAENQFGASVGNVVVPDAPVGSTFTFSVSDARFEFVGSLLKLKSTQSVLVSSGSTINLDVTATDQTNATFTQRMAISVVANPFPWHNPGKDLGEDADGNGTRDINDATFIITLLRAGQGGTLSLPRPAITHYGDVVANGTLDINDVLGVIAYLRLKRVSGGEGERAIAPAASATVSAEGSSWDLALASISQDLTHKRKPLADPDSATT